VDTARGGVCSTVSTSTYRYIPIIPASDLSRATPDEGTRTTVTTATMRRRRRRRRRLTLKLPNSSSYYSFSTTPPP